MQIYHYNHETGEYAGSSEAPLSPLDEQLRQKALEARDAGEDVQVPEPVYLIPAYATDVVPPAPSDNQAAVFSDGAWALVPDFRGKQVYRIVDGHLQEPVIMALGDALPADAAVIEGELPDLPKYCAFAAGMVSVDQAAKDADTALEAAGEARKARIDELYAGTNQADAGLSVPEKMYRIGRLERGLPEV